MRSPFRYYGGKGNMVAKLLPLIPPHKVYVEPFCGAAWLFFAKEPSPVEVLNDLNGHIVNCFRCLQDHDLFAELDHRLLHTLYSYDEFKRALEILKDEQAQAIDRAWAWMVAQNQGFSGEARTPGNWGRVFTSCNNMAETTSRWNTRLETLPRWHDRLLAVQLDHRDALEVIKYWDSTETFFYCDPPYMPSTRTKGNQNVYKHEMTESQHLELVKLLCQIKGQAMVSGYESPIYHELEQNGYIRKEFKTVCHAAGRVRGSKIHGQGSALQHVPRTEVIWLKRHDGNNL